MCSSPATRLLALALVLLTAVPARADDPPVEPGPEPGSPIGAILDAAALGALQSATEAAEAQDRALQEELKAAQAERLAAHEEITVVGEFEVQRLRSELDIALRNAGYYEGKRRDGRTVYRPKISYKPTIVVYDEGFVLLRRNRTQWGVPKGVNPLWNLACPVAIHMCVRPWGLLISKARLDAHKALLLEEIGPLQHEWTEAQVAANMIERLEHLADELDASWTTGAPLSPGEPQLPTMDERRAALLAMWSDRTCTPEGQAVADTISLFLEMVVQESEWPVSAAEQDAANAACRCERTLDLPLDEAGAAQ